IFGNAANADVADREPSDATGFDQVVNFFTRTEAIPEIADGAEIDEIGSNAYQMIGDTAEFGKDHPDVLSTFGYFDPEHLFDRHCIGDAIHHRRHVVEPIGEGNHLPIHVRFRHLLETAVEISDFGV